uniref:Uncharacterized protein n=1 Tax=Cannabis sativa TaxID=3483 RepID=A0A803QZZ2_CANSA
MADAFFVPFFSSLNFNTHGHNMNTDRVDRRLQDWKHETLTNCYIDSVSLFCCDVVSSVIRAIAINLEASSASLFIKVFFFFFWCFSFM